MFELRLVRHALALARYRNFARAAEALHLTQPSLSRSIATLEGALGVRLFDRAKSGVRPTAFGELLLARGAALVAGEADLRREIQLLAGLEAGTLRIGAGPYPTEISAGPAVARLLVRYPRLKVEVISADPRAVAEGVLGGQFDVGIGNARVIAETPRLSFEPLPEHPIHFACRPSHPLAGRRDLLLPEILAYGLAASVLVGPTGQTAAQIGGRGAGTLDEASGVFVPSIFVNSLSVARRIARESDAILPATADMVAQDLQAGALVTLDFHVPEMMTKYGLITSADRSPAPATEVFMDIVREVEAEIAAAETERGAASRIAAEAARPRAARKRAVKR
jgi:DNA-binding transcriptional LysR family regulator